MSDQHWRMIKRFSLALLSIALLLSPSPVRSSGEEKGPQKPGSVRLDEIPELLRKMDEGVKAKADALAGVLEVEVKANRVSAAVLQSLRAALISLEPSSGIDAQALLSNLSVPLPMDNEAIADAVGALRAASAGAQNERVAIFRRALPAIEKRVTELTRSAVSSSEVEPVLANVEMIEELAQSQVRVRNSVAPMQLNALSNCVKFLRAFSQLLNSRPSDDASSLSQTIRKFQSAGQAANEFVADDALRKRLSSTVDPIKDAVDSARAAVTEALLQGKPSAVVSSALAKYDEAAKRYAITGNYLDLPGLRQFTNRTPAYQSLATLARAVETKQWQEVKQGLGNAKQSIRTLEDPESAKLEDLLGKWEHELKEATEGSARALHELIHSKLVQTKTPADLEALAAEIAKPESELRKNQDAESLQGLANQLTALAAAWSSDDLTYFSSGGRRGRMGVPVGYAKDFAIIESLAERDVTVRRLRAPELNQPPLAEMPLDAAVEKLHENLAAGGEWRRLLQILEARNEPSRPGSESPHELDATSSIRAYLAAQNFELAEQWTEAASAYKTVLRNAADNTPVKESALRLKEITRAHPSDVKASESLNVPLNLFQR